MKTVFNNNGSFQPVKGGSSVLTPMQAGIGHVFRQLWIDMPEHSRYLIGNFPAILRNFLSWYATFLMDIY